MKALFSIIKYYPVPERDDAFSIGLIIVCPDNNECIKKISDERVKRINSAFGVKRSLLVENTIIGIKNNVFSKKELEYLSIYENGVVRYTTPQIVVSDDIQKTFDDLYLKLISDLKDPERKAAISDRVSIRKYVRTLMKADTEISRRLSIGYRFEKKQIIVSKFLFSSTEIDFIGGNGALYCGEVPDLEQNSESLEKNLNKTFVLFDVLNRLFSPLDRFKPKDCKIIIDSKQADNPENSEALEKIENWHKDFDYDLLIGEPYQIIDTIKKQISERKVRPFDEWINDTIATNDLTLGI